MTFLHDEQTLDDAELSEALVCPSPKHSSRHSTDGNLQVSVSAPGTELVSDQAASVRRLFSENYFRYHYLSEMLEVSRFRFLATLDGRLVGYATVAPRGGFGILSNLLVDSAYRGSGIGGALEAARMHTCGSQGLRPYSSCTTVGTGSQHLKRKHGLAPMNIRYGVRSGVARDSLLESGVTFVGGDVAIAEWSHDQIVEDGGLGRSRLISSDLGRVLFIAEQWAGMDVYADVLVPPSLAAECMAEPRLVFAGVDVDYTSTLVGALFQVRNQRFWSAAEHPGQICFNVPEFFQRVWTQVLGSTKC